MRLVRTMLVVLLGFVFSACAGAGAMTSDPGTTATGDASYYADKFIGQTTANGETYDPEAMTAAHRSLPFGTRVRVTCLATGASVVVRINDRGPFVRGRVIDLSHAAARELGMLREGVVPVTLEVINGEAGGGGNREGND